MINECSPINISFNRVKIIITTTIFKLRDNYIALNTRIFKPCELYLLMTPNSGSRVSRGPGLFSGRRGPVRRLAHTSRAVGCAQGAQREKGCWPGPGRALAVPDNVSVAPQTS